MKNEVDDGVQERSGQFSYHSRVPDDESGIFENESVKQGSVKLRVAENENRAVWCLRFFVIFLLTSVALAICLTVYFTAKDGQQQDFEKGFDEVGVKVVESFELTLRQRVGIIENLAQDITAYENNSPNISFPFVTVPDFERRAHSIGKLASIMSAGIFAVIESEEREAWDAYSSNPKNQEWLAEGISVRTGIPLEEAKAQVTPSPIAPSIWGVFPGQDPPIGPETRPGPYVVQWQISPATTAVVYNLNLATHPHYVDAIKTVINEKQTVFPASYDFTDPATRDTDPRRPMIQSFLASYESYGTGVTYDDDPILPLLVPSKWLHVTHVICNRTSLYHRAA